MKLTIFDVYVPMQDQEQCDRMKQVCVDNGLPYWKHRVAFQYINNPIYNEESYFCLCGKEFFVTVCWNKNKTQVTEVDFLILLNEWKSKENGKNRM